MTNKEILLIVIVGIAAVALVVFLIWKNHKDKKLLNPEAPLSVEIEKEEQLRQKETPDGI